MGSSGILAGTIIEEILADDSEGPRILLRDTPTCLAYFIAVVLLHVLKECIEHSTEIVAVEVLTMKTIATISATTFTGLKQDKYLPKYRNYK